MSDTDILAQKLSDRHLLERAVNGVAEQTVVLIQVALPPAQATIKHKLRGGVHQAVVAGVQPESPAQREQAERTVKELDTFLTELLGESPRWISVARVFVANASGEQLRAIAQSSLVRAIRPNRRLR